MAVRYATYSRPHRPNGRLVALGDRMSELMQIRREERMSRRAVRSFAIELGTVRGALVQFFSRGIFGRLKWLVIGR